MHGSSREYLNCALLEYRIILHNTISLDLVSVLKAKLVLGFKIAV